MQTTTAKVSYHFYPNLVLRLDDIIRELGGSPIRIDIVCVLLDRADRFLPGGRDYHELLTAKQVRQLIRGE